MTLPGDDRTLKSVATPWTRVLRWNATPVRLKLAGAAIATMVIVLAGVVMVGAARHRTAVQLIGVNTAPAVIKAHDIKIWIETLDADTLDELLDPPSDMGSWVSDFDKHRVEIGNHVIEATRNITFGDSELVPIQKIEESLGRYLMAARAARDAHVRGDQAEMMSSYRESYSILQNELVPAANSLYAANDSVLDTIYAQQVVTSRHTRWLTVIVGVIVTVMLVVIQVFIARRFRRRLNPGLVAATLVTVIAMSYATGAFAAHARHLAALESDAYQSIEALVGARADAYETNAAESRWLLDQDFRKHHERTFVDHAAKLVSFAPSADIAKLIERIDMRAAMVADLGKHGVDEVVADRRAIDEYKMQGVDGELIRALDNVTFPEEMRQADEALHAFGTYVGRDATIRSLELAGKHADAVAFEVGMKETDSNYAFYKFDTAIQRWVQTNQDWMERYRDAAFSDIKGLEGGAPIVALAILACLLFGLRPRLREYA